MNEQILGLGIILIFIGFILVFVSALLGGQGESKFAIGGFIGPIPFGSASRGDILKLVMIVSLIFFILFLVLGQKLI